MQKEGRTRLRFWPEIMSDIEVVLTIFTPEKHL